MMVAPPGRWPRRITLPLAGPSVLAGALVIFVLAVSDFGVPGLLRVRVYTTEVFTAFAALDDFARDRLLAHVVVVALRWGSRDGCGSAREVSCCGATAHRHLPTDV